MRKLSAILVAGVMALAIAAPVFAATASGSTTVSAVGPAATISLTVPASVTYALDVAPEYMGTEHLTNVQTNNPTGLTVSMTFTNLVAGPTTVLTADMKDAHLIVTAGGVGAGLTAAPVNAYGFYSGSPSNVGTVATSTGAFSQAAAIDVTSYAKLTIPGNYAGVLAWVASTNP